MSRNPGAAVAMIRLAFGLGAIVTAVQLRFHQPPRGTLKSITVDFGDGSGFRAYQPTDAKRLLPVIAWIHGGAWIGGNKRDVEPYLRILASHGYVAVALRYSRAPDARYPDALGQLNSALGHLIDHAETLGIDQRRVVLAGDSAGAQLASQLALLVTSPAYAQRVGIRPTVTAAQLRGVILHSGVFDLGAMNAVRGINAWGFQVALRAYTGARDWAGSAAGTAMSTIDFVTSEFPATFLSGGNGDALTQGQSVPLARRLREAGVEVSTLFWPASHRPRLPHEYQFHLMLKDARIALDQTLEFLRERTT